MIGNLEKKNYCRALLVVVLGLALFCKPGVPEEAGQKGTNVARFRASVRDAMGPKAKHVTLLYPGEEIEVLKQAGHQSGKGQKTLYSFVRTSDGKEGYIRSAYLAVGALVVTGEDVKLYRRNNVTSGPGSGAEMIKPGVLAYILQRTAENRWLQVRGSVGKKSFSGWIPGDFGFSRDKALISAAIVVGNVRELLEQKPLPVQKLQDIRKKLEEIQDAAAPIGPEARELLARIDALPTDGPPAPGEGKTGEQSGGEEKPVIEEPKNPEPSG